MTKSSITFNVAPSRSPEDEHVFVRVESTGSHAAARLAHATFWLTRDDAYRLGAELTNAAAWLEHESRDAA